MWQSHLDCQYYTLVNQAKLSWFVERLDNTHNTAKITLCFSINRIHTCIYLECRCLKYFTLVFFFYKIGHVIMLEKSTIYLYTNHALTSFDLIWPADTCLICQSDMMTYFGKIVLSTFPTWNVASTRRCCIVLIQLKNIVRINWILHQRRVCRTFYIDILC